MSDHETPPDDKADKNTGETGPEPRWREDGALVSDRFGDVYFSRDGGLDETRHVFLKGCGLPERWQNRGCPFSWITSFRTQQRRPTSSW